MGYGILQLKIKKTTNIFRLVYYIRVLLFRILGQRVMQKQKGVHKFHTFAT